MFSDFPIPPPVPPVNAGGDVRALWNYNIEFRAWERHALRWHCAVLGVSGEETDDADKVASEVSDFDPTSIDRAPRRDDDGDDGHPDPSTAHPACTSCLRILDEPSCLHIESTEAGELPDDDLPQSESSFCTAPLSNDLPSSPSSCPSPVNVDPYPDAPTSPAPTPRWERPTPDCSPDTQDLIKLLRCEDTEQSSPRARATTSDLEECAAQHCKDESDKEDGERAPASESQPPEKRRRASATAAGSPVQAC